MVYETQKDYFVILQQVGEQMFKVMCVVEDEDIARDFCEKYHFTYEKQSVIKEVNQTKELVKNIFG